MSKAERTFISQEHKHLVVVSKNGYNSRKLCSLIILPICCMCLVSTLCSIGLSLLFINFVILNNDSPVIINNVSHHNYNLSINTNFSTPPQESSTTAPSNSSTHTQYEYYPMYPLEEYEPYIEDTKNNNTPETNYYIKKFDKIPTSDGNIIIPPPYYIIIFITIIL